VAKENLSSTLAMLGGGQLGRFFVMSAQKLGYKVLVLDPDPNSPAGQIADNHLCATYDDEQALRQIIDSCDYVSTEFENIPAHTLQFLEKDLTVRPSSKAVSIVQNRILEKSFLKDNNFPVGDFIIISSLDDLQKVELSIFPAILKIAQFGYDGKGQIHVNNTEELEKAFKKFKNAPCVLEKKINLDTEVSVVLARSNNNEKVFYPLVENQHINGILDTSIIPAEVNQEIYDEALKIADHIASVLDYVGVMAVEFFVCQNHAYVNEIAPRPHNSGHFSIDACDYSQFDLQVRTLTGMKLEQPKLIHKSRMINLLGDVWFRGDSQINPPFNNIKDESIKLHLYGKKEPRVGRKMGHFTVLGDDPEKIKELAFKTKEMLLS